jgi:hypothetical protein
VLGGLCPSDTTPVAADADRIYFSGVVGQGASAVFSIRHDGTQLTQLASGSAARIVVDGSSVYWLERGQPAMMGCAPTGGAIRVVPTTGGDVHTLASSLAGAVGLAVADGFAYFGESGFMCVGENDNSTWQINRVPTTGGMVETIAHVDSVSEIAVTIGRVLWIGPADFISIGTHLLGGTGK